MSASSFLPSPLCCLFDVQSQNITSTPGKQIYKFSDLLSDLCYAIAMEQPTPEAQAATSLSAFFSPKFQAACSQRYEIGSGTSMTLGTSVLGSTYGQFILIFLTPGILTFKLCLHSMAPVWRCYLMEGLQSLPHL